MGDIVLLLGERWVWGFGVEYGGESTYSSVVRVVLPVIATARALAPSAPILFSPTLKRAGKGSKQVEQRINTFA